MENIFFFIQSCVKSTANLFVVDTAAKLKVAQDKINAKRSISMPRTNSSSPSKLTIIFYLISSSFKKNSMIRAINLPENSHRSISLASVREKEGEEQEEKGSFLLR